MRVCLSNWFIFLSLQVCPAMEMKKGQRIQELWISFCDRFQKTEVKSNDLISIFKPLTRKCYAGFFINTLIFYSGSSCKSSKLTLCFPAQISPAMFSCPSRSLLWLCCWFGPDLDTHVALCPQTNISRLHLCERLPESTDVNS